MSLLQQNQNPFEASDDAARGEDLAKGTSHVLLAAIIAAVVVSAAIGIYFYTHRQKPIVDGAVVEFWAHPQHSVTRAFDANGEPMHQEQIDHVLLFAHARLRNVSDKPLFLNRIAFNVTLDDGIHTSYAAAKSEYERVFMAYPELAAYRREGMQTETTLEPGQTIEGDFATNYRLTRAEWEARKDLNLTFQFRYQPDLVMPIAPAAVTMR